MKTKALLLIAALFSPFCLMAVTSQPAKVCPACPKGSIDYETLIAFLPVIFFLFILFITIIKLRNDKIKLSNLLEEKDPPASDATAPAQSVSRFIAFLTGLVALTIGVCITTFYMYVYFSKPDAKIDLSNLTSVIWGLGIGVIPYGANKVSSALKSNT